jgi:hypothetical protein
MEATLGISLYSCLYPKLAKSICLSYYLLCLLSNKIREESKTGSAWKLGIGGMGVVGELAQCIHMQVNVKMVI